MNSLNNIVRKPAFHLCRVEQRRSSSSSSMLQLRTLQSCQVRSTWPHGAAYMLPRHVPLRPMRSVSSIAPSMARRTVLVIRARASEGPSESHRQPSILVTMPYEQLKKLLRACFLVYMLVSQCSTGATLASHRQAQAAACMPC